MLELWQHHHFTWQTQKDEEPEQAKLEEEQPVEETIKEEETCEPQKLELLESLQMIRPGPICIPTTQY